MLSAREMAGFLTALLHAWLLLQGGRESRKAAFEKGSAANKDSFPLPKPKNLLLGLINHSTAHSISMLSSSSSAVKIPMS